MGVYEETIELKDGISGPAGSAAKSVLSVSDKMTILKSSIASTHAAMVKASATGNVKQFGKLQKDLGGLTSALGALPPASSSASSGMGGLNAELAEMTGGISLVAEVAAGVVLAFGAVVVAGMAMAIQANEAKQAMLGLFDALGEGKVTGAQTEEMIDGLKAKLGISKDAMIDWTKKLMAMGMTDLGQLEKSLTATASAAALVKGGDEAFEKLTKKIQTAVQAGTGLKIVEKGLAGLAGVGLTVDDVAQKMGVSAKSLAAQLKAGTVDAGKFGDAMQNALIEKGKGPLERLAASSGNIKKLFMESIGDMFEDIDVGPFMQQVKELFDIFSQAKPSGQALKAGIGGFFKEVFVIATKVVPYIKRFLLDLVILGLKAYIGLKPVTKWFKELAANQTVVAVFWAALKGLGMAALTVGIVIATVVAVFVGLGLALMAIQVAIVAVGGIILGFVASAGAALSGWVKGAASAAYDFVAGLVKGIANGAGQVGEAVKGLAKSATGAFKSALGIASPSKVMMQLGGHTGAGFAQGLEDTAGDVHASASGISAAAFSGASSGGTAAPAKSGSGGGNTINVSVAIDGAGKSAMEITEEMVSACFERIALSAGV